VQINIFQAFPFLLPIPSNPFGRFHYEFPLWLATRPPNGDPFLWARGQQRGKGERTSILIQSGNGPTNRHEQVGAKETEAAAAAAANPHQN
jgi:hypothetical protein